MFEYYKFTFEEDDSELISYVELDLEGFCVRNIIEVNGQLFTSNFINTNNPYFLPEKSFQEFKSELSLIEEEEFKNKWKAKMDKKRSMFESLKEELSLNSIVTSTINCFYPQGVILKLQNDFHGITNYEACLQKVGSERMNIGTSLVSKIIGYDDHNLMFNIEVMNCL